MTVSYEWVAEPMDIYGDIIDPLFGDTLADVITFAEGFTHPAATCVAYALVRNVGDEINGLKDRDYAYLDKGKLPAKFPEAETLVPAKYHREAAITWQQ